jgi:HSP20 family protein
MNTLTRETRESDRGQAEQFITPPASVTEIGDGYMLEIEMPGVKKDGLEISVESNELAIIGRRSLPAVEGTLIHRESRPENFRRAFEIDPSIDADKITAKIDQGLMTLTLPKAEHVKPRRITVS